MSMISSIGLYRIKSKSIKNSFMIIVDDFEGEFPNTREQLMLLPGVGRKTANDVLSVSFGFQL